MYLFNFLRADFGSFLSSPVTKVCAQATDFIFQSEGEPMGTNKELLRSEEVKSASRVI